MMTVELFPCIHVEIETISSLHILSLGNLYRCIFKLELFILYRRLYRLPPLNHIHMTEYVFFNNIISSYLTSVLVLVLVSLLLLYLIQIPKSSPMIFSLFCASIIIRLYVLLCNVPLCLIFLEVFC